MSIKDGRIKDLKDDEVMMGSIGLDLRLYMVKGERYRGKRPVIEEWLDADRKRDEKLKRTVGPEGIPGIQSFTS